MGMMNTGDLRLLRRFGLAASWGGQGFRHPIGGCSYATESTKRVLGKTALFLQGFGPEMLAIVEAGQARYKPAPRPIGETFYEFTCRYRL
jgi:hypothetical protein